MATFEVDYTYYVPQHGVTTVVATDVDNAEDVVLEQLSESLDADVQELEIDAIKELKQ
jgi:hypothetical protein